MSRHPSRFSRFERTLLASGRRDEPSRERRNAARASLLRTAGAATIVAVTATATATTSAQAASSSATSAVASATTITMKTLSTKLLIAVIIGVGAVATGSAALVLSSSSSASSSSSSQRAAPSHEAVAIATAVNAPSVVVDAPSNSSTPSIPVVDIHVMPSVAVTAAQNKDEHSSETAAPPPEVEDPLATQAKLLEGARSCLASGDRACARARLRSYNTQFGPQSALGDEAAVLAIDLALADGDRDTAQHLASALLTSKPNGPWTSHVRRLAEQERQKGTP